VRGANGTSGYAVPLRVIPERGQVPENSAHSSSKQSCDVFHDDVAGSKLANESGIFGPKTRAGAVDAGASAGEAEVLAGETSTEDVDRLGLDGGELADIGVARDVRPVAGEDTATEGIGFALPEHAHTGPLQAEVEPADPGEQGADIHAARSDPLVWSM